jgi:hypothetical protein
MFGLLLEEKFRDTLKVSAAGAVRSGESKRERWGQSANSRAGLLILRYALIGAMY